MANSKMTDAELKAAIKSWMDAAQNASDFNATEDLAKRVAAPVRTVTEMTALLAGFKTKTNGQRMNIATRVFVLGGKVVLDVLKAAKAEYGTDGHGLGGNASGFSAKALDAMLKGSDKAAAILVAKAGVGVKTARDKAVASNESIFKTAGENLAPLKMSPKDAKAYRDALKTALDLTAKYKAEPAKAEIAAAA